MITFNISESEAKLFRTLIINEITDLAENTEYLETISNPKEYIDERISLCKHFDLNLWNIVDLYCNHFILERLRALYDGKSVKEFIENYESPSEPELKKQFLNALIKYKRN